MKTDSTITLHARTLGEYDQVCVWTTITIFMERQEDKYFTSVIPSRHLEKNWQYFVKVYRRAKKITIAVPRS
jgi:hypothetical protein